MVCTSWVVILQSLLTIIGVDQIVSFDAGVVVVLVWVGGMGASTTT